MWNNFQLKVIRGVRDVSVLDQFLDISERLQSELNGCNSCRLEGTFWIAQVSKKIDNLPKYSEA